MRHRVPTAAVLAALVLLGGCTDAEEQPAAAPATVGATPLAPPSPAPSPSPEPSPSPAPSPSPSLSPSPSPSPSPEPSPTASPRPADFTEEAALAAAQRRQAERGDCDEGFADDAHRVVATVDGRMLVHVVCFLGAYQPSGELRTWDGRELAPLPVEQWQAGEVVETGEVVGFVDGSPDGARVVNDVRYRGLGDCGLQQRWTFDGSSLRLDVAREQQCEDDGEFVPPSEWPVVYSR